MTFEWRFGVALHAPDASPGNPYPARTTWLMRRQPASITPPIDPCAETER